MSVTSIRAATQIYPLRQPLVAGSLFTNKLKMPTTQKGQRARRSIVLPSVMMRSGTSKGLYLHEKDLPPSKTEWNDILLAAMGSREGDQRQLDGVGGATSTTSKVAVITKSRRPGIDVDYTFVQIGVGSNKVDFSGNCGNICAGVGPFALDEGLVSAEAGQTEIDVSIFNTNTSRKIVQRLQVDSDGRFCEDGDYRIGGVKGTASQIKVTFVDPAGSMTNQLFPSGRRQDVISVTSEIGNFDVRVSMVDAANPFVFVDASTMPMAWRTLSSTDKMSLDVIESIRCAGAVKMGLATSEAAAHLIRGTPKIALLSRSHAHNGIWDNRKGLSDIHVDSYSMGKPHPSFQLTGAVCLSAAACIPGTIASDLKHRHLNVTPPGTPPEVPTSCDGVAIENPLPRQNITIEHSSGTIDAEVDLTEHLNGEFVVDGVAVSRTARRLFEGNVLIRI